MQFIVLIFKSRCWYNLRSGVLGLCITGQFFSLRRSPTFSARKRKKHLMAGYWWCSNLARTKNIKCYSDRVYFLSFFVVVVVLFGFLRTPPPPPSPPASFLYNFKTAHDSRPPKLAIILIRTVSDKIK